MDFEFNGLKLEIFDGMVYRNNGAMAVRVTGEDGPYATLSVNVDEMPQKGHFWAKTWGENEELVQFLLENKYMEFTGRTHETGYVKAMEAKLIYRDECDYCHKTRPKTELMDLHDRCGTPILAVCRGPKDIDGEYSTGCKQEDIDNYFNKGEF